MSNTTDAGDAIQSLVSSYQSTLSSVSSKAVLSQMGIMGALSLGTLIAFSFLRPENRRVYAPKIKYAQAAEIYDPLNAPEPPPEVSNSFFAWFSPVLHTHESAMLNQIGLDGVTFLRTLRLIRMLFLGISIICGGVLIPINVVYNLKKVSANSRNYLSLLTLQNLSGDILWAHVAVSYIINIMVMWSVWYHWKKMVLLRQAWFRSDGYMEKIYGRTLMITGVPKLMRTDEGLIQLMGMLKVDGIKIVPQIDCTSIGRKLDDFPDLVHEHNEAVRSLEQSLVQYLKNDQMGKKRPQYKKGGFLGMGGQKMDAIEYYSKKVKFMRDKIDNKRSDIEAMIRKERHARKFGGKKGQDVRPHGENYGFVTMKTIAEAHRIARAHRGRQKELRGAEIQLAPSPKDLVWQNITMDAGEHGRKRVVGFIIIAVVCFFNTVPLLFVSLLANLSALTLYVPFFNTWKNAGQWGNWTFSLVSGVLPSIISAAFGFVLPMIMRKISRYQGAITKSRLDRAVTQRLFAFFVVSNFVIFSLIGVAYAVVAAIVTEVGQHQSFATIMSKLGDVPQNIEGAYVQQSTYWLTVFPLRGFLIIFELAQLIKLILLSFRRLLFAKTPRDVKEWTVPPFFEYSVVLPNLLFVAAIGMLYAPVAPLVVIGCTIVFWVSSIVYKYNLLYVYVSKVESGGRLFNIAANRILACAVLMQLLMILIIGLNRRRYTDVIASAPPILCILAFKFFVVRPLEHSFRYYVPNAEEAQAEWEKSRAEKRTHHSEMEKRFLHPALQSKELFTVMVHKSQEQLAKEVLSVYPWFSAQKGDGGLQLKGVREENLEYDPSKDGLAKDDDGKSEADWDARSEGSTPMMEGPGQPGIEGQIQNYFQHGPTQGRSTPDIGGYGFVPEGSTDNLIDRRGNNGYEMQDQRRGIARGPGSLARAMRDRGNDDPIAASPLLATENQQPWNQGYISQPPLDQGYSHQADYPHPPPSFTSGPQIGYSPALSRSDSHGSEGQAPLGYGQPWPDQRRNY